MMKGLGSLGYACRGIDARTRPAVASSGCHIHRDKALGRAGHVSSCKLVHNLPELCCRQSSTNRLWRGSPQDSGVCHPYISKLSRLPLSRSREKLKGGRSLSGWTSYGPAMLLSLL